MFVDLLDYQNRKKKGWKQVDVSCEIKFQGWFELDQDLLNNILIPYKTSRWLMNILTSQKFKLMRSF